MPLTVKTFIKRFAFTQCCRLTPYRLHLLTLLFCKRNVCTKEIGHDAIYFMSEIVQRVAFVFHSVYQMGECDKFFCGVDAGFFFFGNKPVGILVSRNKRLCRSGEL